MFKNYAAFKDIIPPTSINFFLIFGVGGWGMEEFCVSLELAKFYQGSSMLIFIDHW